MPEATQLARQDAWHSENAEPGVSFGERRDLLTISNHDGEHFTAHLEAEVIQRSPTSCEIECYASEEGQAGRCLPLGRDSHRGLFVLRGDRTQLTMRVCIEGNGCSHSSAPDGSSDTLSVEYRDDRGNPANKKAEAYRILWRSPCRREDGVRVCCDPPRTVDALVVRDDESNAGETESGKIRYGIEDYRASDFVLRSSQPEGD